MDALWTWIADADPWLTGGMLGALMAGGWYAGWHWGRRRRARGAAQVTESKLGDASLAILGLLLAFTFSMALNKYDRRRDALVNDSNAIGDLYTCASLLPEPRGGQLRAVVRDYTRLRVDIGHTACPTIEEIRRTLGRFDAMVAQMTDLVRDSIADGTPIAGPLT